MGEELQENGWKLECPPCKNEIFLRFSEHGWCGLLVSKLLGLSEEVKRRDPSTGVEELLSNMF